MSVFKPDKDTHLNFLSNFLDQNKLYVDLGLNPKSK